MRSLPVKVTTGAFGLIGLVFAVSVLASAQQAKPAPPPAPTPGDHSKIGGKMTKEQKIANALSAAPSSVSAKATIMDWPEKEGGPLVKLRDGSNGWTCLPHMPMLEGNAPMCLDSEWMKWLDGYVNHKTPPAYSHIGLGYMLAPGGASDSNTDPYATKMTPDNQWGNSGPHLMVIVPDAAALKGVPTDRHNGGPFVMWAGTPYAHIMAPTTAASAKMMPMAPKK